MAKRIRERQQDSLRNPESREIPTYIDHVDRMSSEMASLADELSRREKSKDLVTAKKLKDALFSPVSGFLMQWLQNPTKGEDLYMNLLKELTS